MENWKYLNRERGELHIVIEISCLELVSERLEEKRRRELIEDALKADVIEYEERYELCKRENAATLKQLEKVRGREENEMEVTEMYGDIYS